MRRKRHGKTKHKNKGHKMRENEETLPHSLISATKLLRDDFHKFLLLTSIALIFGGTGIAIAYGCLIGAVVMVLIMIFVLSALYMRWHFTRN